MGNLKGLLLITGAGIVCVLLILGSLGTECLTCDPLRYTEVPETSTARAATKIAKLSATPTKDVPSDTPQATNTERPPDTATATETQFVATATDRPSDTLTPRPTEPANTQTATVTLVASPTQRILGTPVSWTASPTPAPTKTFTPTPTGTDKPGDNHKSTPTATQILPPGGQTANTLLAETGADWSGLLLIVICAIIGVLLLLSGFAQYLKNRD